MTTTRMTNKNKVRDKSGYSLVELLCVIIILVLVSTCLVTGVSLCASTYTKLVNFSRAQTLASTISPLISDELRYAKSVQVQDGNLSTYSSITQGKKARMDSSSGKIVIYSDNAEDGACILGESAYPESYSVNMAPISVINVDGYGLFFVSFQVFDQSGTEVKKIEFQVKSLNKCMPDS